MTAEKKTHTREKATLRLLDVVTAVCADCKEQAAWSAVGRASFPREVPDRQIPDPTVSGTGIRNAQIVASLVR